MDEIKLVMRKSDNLEDWYLIERAQHDGRMWMEPCDGGMALRSSARLSNADVEGDASEMLAIAKAIEARGRVSFRRCAVAVVGDRVEFWSPRNSTENGVTSYTCAAELAMQIFADIIPATEPEASA